MGSPLKVYALKALRGIIRELRFVKPKTSPRNMMAYQYLMEQYRKNQTTQEQICRAHNEMLHQAQTYLCLLKSSREFEELYGQYSRGERTVEESAKLVGLELPKPPPAID